MYGYYRGKVVRVEGAYEQVDRRLGRIGEEIGQLRSDVNSRIEGVEGRIEGLRWEMNGRIDETNRVIEGLHTEMNGQIEGLRGEVNKRMGDLETRLNAILISVIVVGGGVVGSLVALVLRTT